MPKHIVPFSWRALLLAPLVISGPAGVLLASGSKYPIVGFGICALVSYVFALAVTACLLLPALWLVSRVASITAWLPPVVGGLIAALLFLAWDYSNWCSSGVDSGPPAEAYPQWIVKSWFTPEPLVVIAFGVITAATYSYLATRKPQRTSKPS
jgi:hypothetical protein